MALNAQDDKRYILQDNIHTLALGHFCIQDSSEATELMLKDEIELYNLEQQTLLDLEELESSVNNPVI